MNKMSINILPWCKLAAVYSVLIDVRSEKEYQRGSIPKAVNIPVLNDDEHHRVGLTYKRCGQKEAVRLGLEVFHRKCAAFLREVIKVSAGSRELTLYCWRGGMRSQLTAKWLQAAGFQVNVVMGGYKGFRHYVLEQICGLANHRLLVLNGYTGVGKTKLLHELSKKHQVPVLDFEKHANHRGSAFGKIGLPSYEVTQQNFENNLALSYANVQAYGCIVVEIEGKIGPVQLSKSVQKNIYSSPMVFLERNFLERVDIICKDYTYNWKTEDLRLFTDKITLLTKFIGKQAVSEIKQWVQQGSFHKVIKRLLLLRYDKSYEKSLKRHLSQAIATYNLSTSKDQAIARIKDFCFNARCG